VIFLNINGTCISTSLDKYTIKLCTETDVTDSKLSSVTRPELAGTRGRVGVHARACLGSDSTRIAL